MNGDEIRDVTFPRGYGCYDAAQVDALLDYLAVELDAGRPVGPRIADATFRRPGRRSRGYDTWPVDWFLDKLRTREERAGTGADPWRDLAVANHFTRSGPGLAQECKGAWLGFDQQPGTHLRWVRVGHARWELRTAEQQTMASGPGHPGHSWLAPKIVQKIVRVGGRSFTASAGSSSQEIPEIVARSARDRDGHFVADAPRQAKVGSYKPSRVALAAGLSELVDETDTPMLYVSGWHYDRVDEGCVTFPDRRWLRFPVRGTRRSNGIMTAVDEGGNNVARYRVTGRGPATTVEITVHPDWKLTDERVLAIAISAPWLPQYFLVNVGGGGG